MKLMKHTVARGARTLDFVVIGAPKCGTTSLWQYLRSHPAVFMPDVKEAPFFGRETKYPGGLAEFLDVYFPTAPAGALLGTATPKYMQGWRGVPVDEIARRIRRTLPRVKLVAILRDPVVRAFSAYRESVALGAEARSFADAVAELLEPSRLAAGRDHPGGWPGDGVIVGEYGRTLRPYIELFAPDRLHVCFTEDLEREPRRVMAELFTYLGVDPEQATADLAVRHKVGGSTLRADKRARTRLMEYLDERVWSRLDPETRRVERDAFKLWFRLWNLIPDERAPTVPPEARALLEEHYRDDQAELEALLGRPLPWGDRAS